MNARPSIRISQFVNKDIIGNRKVIFKAHSNSIINGNIDIPHLPVYGDFSNSGSNKMFGIGEIPNLHFFNGSIAEVIVYEKDVSVSERLRMESYVAIKYGITLGSPTTPINYTSSLSTGSNPASQTIWTGNAAFQNNIIGIGRDNISNLIQKQSHQADDSVRVYLGNLQTTNALNTSTFTLDRSFVVMGSNNKKLHATDASNAEMYPGIPINGSCDLFSVIERKWKVQRTNMSDLFNIDIKLTASAKLNLIDPSDLRLIVDNDANLSNGWQGCYANGNNGLAISYSNGVVSIKGISTSHIANNVIRYISIGSIDRGTPLPIELNSFEANCSRTNVELLWKTESETNNDYFTIEKSIDGINYEVLAISKGKGTKNTSSSYSFTDYTNQVGLAYYKLSQTDFDGRTTELKTISSNCEGELELMIYPNPTNNGVYLTLNGKTELGVNVGVYDLKGQELSKYEINGSTYIHLPKESGFYLIRYVLNGQEKIEKVVKY